MYKLITLTVTAMAVFIVFTAGVMDDNGRAGVTGAPGEATCNQPSCHNTYALNSGTGSMSATSTMNNWKYVPGTLYTISVTVRKAGVPLFGLGVEICQSSGDNCGTLIVSNTAKTQIKTRTIGTVIRRAIVHTLNGGRSADSCIFTFNWMAPSTDVGNITLYAAGNAANSNASATGDYIYTMNQIITPDSGTSIDQYLSTENSIHIFPNPVSERFNVTFNQKQNSNVNISLMDIKGSHVAELFNGIVSTGEFNQQFEVPSSCTSGIYTLMIRNESGVSSKRVVIR